MSAYRAPDGSRVLDTGDDQEPVERLAGGRQGQGARPGGRRGGPRAGRGRARLRREAAALQRRAEAALEGVAGYAPLEEKLTGWALEDRAEALALEADLMAARREERLQAALSHTPELPEAHEALVETYLERHRQAEETREQAAAAKAEVRLSHHAGALPARHPARLRAQAWLRGDGALSLETDPPGAEVLLHRYELHQRRLVPVFQRALGRTPLARVPLTKGSYLLLLRAPGRQEVRYPVHLGRSELWDGAPPGEDATLPIWLPPEGLLGPEEIYVPPGWFWSGGDPEAHQSAPRRRIWVDGVVLQRTSVTNRDYLAFLNDLVARGQEERAAQVVPRHPSGQQGAPEAAIYGRDGEGRLVLSRDSRVPTGCAAWPANCATGARTCPSRRGPPAPATAP